MDDVALGASIACSGVCLTVVRKTDKTYIVTAIQETLLKSNLGDLLENI